MPELTPKYSSETQELIEYLKNQIKHQQNGFKSRRNKNRISAIRIRITLVVMSAIVTILLGMKIIGYEEYLANIAFVVSAIITALSAIEDYFENKGYWIRYNLTYTQLKSLEDDLEYLLLNKIEGDAMKSKIDEIHIKLKEILDATNTDWLSLRNKDVE